MPKVNMPQSDWYLVLMVLNMAQDQGLVAHIDNVIESIDDQVAAQEA